MVYGKAAVSPSVFFDRFYIRTAYHVGSLISYGMYQDLHIIFVCVIYQPVSILLIVNSCTILVRTHIRMVHQSCSCAQRAVLIQFDRPYGIIFSAVACPVSCVYKGFHVIKSRKRRLFTNSQSQAALLFKFSVSLHYAGAVPAWQGQEVISFHSSYAMSVYILLSG